MTMRSQLKMRDTAAIAAIAGPPNGCNLCTVQRAAEISGESEWTWRARAYQGVVASVKMGGPKSRLLIPENEIHRLIEKGLRPAKEAAE